MIKKAANFLSSIKKKKLDLISEETSPLFRIMAVHNDNEPARRNFANNICAFHIGKGFILSVAHNLRMKNPLPSSFPENVYQNRIINMLSQDDRIIFNNSYNFDRTTDKRYLNAVQHNVGQQLTQKLDSIRFDSRFISMYNDGICKPFLIIQFRNNVFYNDQILTQEINPNHIFHETQLSRYTFIFELELVEAFFNEDICCYRIVNTNERVINKIPKINLDFKIYDKLETNFFCLQSAPIDNLGRLLNKAKIEGLLDHWNAFKDNIQGNYILEGRRYLIEGYFRFGSSGAPYLIYNAKKREFHVNAIQSEASPIQLSINNNRNGNFQYINAIASPLKIVENRLRDKINQKY